MGRVYVMTDSSASIPSELADDLHITIIPTLVSLDANTYEDGVDLTSEEFYAGIRAGKTPHTSGPTVAHFLRAFQAVPRDAAGVLCLTLPRELSVTYESGETAAALFRDQRPGVPVNVLDLSTAIGAQGLVAIEAARQALGGASLEYVTGYIAELARRSGIFAALDTVKYLVRGGRVGRVAGWIATTLNMKPIVEVTREVVPVVRVRTMQRAMDSLIDLVRERVEETTQPRLMVLHAAAPRHAEDLCERLQQLFSPVSILVHGVSPVLGTHAGPGAVGIAYVAEPEGGWAQ